RLLELQPTPVHLLVAGEPVEQFTVPAADVQHTAALGYPVRHHTKIRTQGLRRERAMQAFRRRHRMAPSSATPCRKPCIIWWNSGSSMRKASCPLSVATSAKLTFAPFALRARTTSRLSSVVKNQSLEK